jgi:hypothetical protein
MKKLAKNLLKTYLKEKTLNIVDIKLIIKEYRLISKYENGYGYNNNYDCFMAEALNNYLEKDNTVLCQYSGLIDCLDKKYSVPFFNLNRLKDIHSIFFSIHQYSQIMNAYNIILNNWYNMGYNNSSVFKICLSKVIKDVTLDTLKLVACLTKLDKDISIKLISELY